MSRLKVGDFVKHKEDGSVGLVLTKQNKDGQINFLWLFCGKSALRFVGHYLPKSVKKIRRVKKLINRAKPAILMILKDKKIDNLTYIELLDILK